MGKLQQAQSFQNYYKKSPKISNIITHSQDLEIQDAFKIIQVQLLYSIKIYQNIMVVPIA